GLANAAATMVGQALGAGDPDRASESVRVAGWFNFVFLGAVTVFFLAFAPELVRFFGDNPEVDMIAQRGLRIMVLSFPFYAFGLVVLQAFNGAGDTWTPTWLNFIVFWLIEIPV